MLTFRSCCDASGRSPRYSAWLIGVSLGAALIAVCVQLAVGDSVYTQTLLYAAFPLALLAAEQLSRTSSRSPLVRGAGLILKLAAAYGLFLAVTLLADLI